MSPDRQNAYGVATIASGERKHLSLVYSADAPGVIPLLEDAARDRIERSVRWWRDWTNRGTYGPYRDAVMRSALVLKLMTYAPSGAVVAAPTTSLPEEIGVCATGTTATAGCGTRRSRCARSSTSATRRKLRHLSWILHATRLTWPELQVLYDVFGEAHLPESELSHLSGYANSRPVRVGNDAHGQLQLDVYGEVIDAVTRRCPRWARRSGHGAC